MGALRGNLTLWLVAKSLRTQLAYRVNGLFLLLNGVVLLFVQASVWTALYAQGQRQGTSLSQAITYMVLTNFILNVLRINPGRRIGQSVYSGDLGADMLRPINLMLLHTGNELGRMLFSLAFGSVPIVALAAAVYGLLPPAGPAALALFLTTGALGAVIFLLFDTIVGYSAFWLMNNWYMPWFERALITLLGGTIVPLWFYPKALTDIAAYLPFQYISYMPVDLYLGRVDPAQGWRVMAVQLLWIGILWALERLVWRVAQRKITVQGG